MARENGILKGELKAVGGKLIKCELILKKDIIASIKITGDFFLYPEEAITELENRLLGCQINPEDIQRVLTCFFHHVDLIGAIPQDFINLITLITLGKKE